MLYERSNFLYDLYMTFIFALINEIFHPEEIVQLIHHLDVRVPPEGSLKLTFDGWHKIIFSFVLRDPAREEFSWEKTSDEKKSKTDKIYGYLTSRFIYL